MIKLKRKVINGEIDYIFRAVPGLNTGEVIGFFEQWYIGNLKWQGIKLEDESKLTYGRLVSEGQGIPLGKVGFYGMVAQNKFYDESSFLVNGVIITDSKRREYFGKNKSGSLRIKVSENMPERMFTILGETQEIVLETAKMFKLTLEKTLSV